MPKNSTVRETRVEVVKKALRGYCSMVDDEDVQAHAERLVDDLFTPEPLVDNALLPSPVKP